MKKIFRLALVFVLAGATLVYTGCTKDYSEDIADIKATADANASAIASIQTAISGLNSLAAQVSALEGDVTSLKNAVNALQSATENLDELEDAVAAAQTAIAKIQEDYVKVEDLKEYAEKAKEALAPLAEITKQIQSVVFVPSGTAIEQFLLGGVFATNYATTAKKAQSSAIDTTNVAVVIEASFDVYPKSFASQVTTENAVLNVLPLSRANESAPVAISKVTADDETGRIDVIAVIDTASQAYKNFKNDDYSEYLSMISLYIFTGEKEGDGATYVASDYIPLFNAQELELLSDAYVINVDSTDVKMPYVKAGESSKKAMLANPTFGIKIGKDTLSADEASELLGFPVEDLAVDFAYASGLDANATTHKSIVIDTVANVFSIKDTTAAVAATWVDDYALDTLFAKYQGVVDTITQTYTITKATGADFWVSQVGYDWNYLAGVPADSNFTHIAVDNLSAIKEDGVADFVTGSLGGTKFYKDAELKKEITPSTIAGVTYTYRSPELIDVEVDATGYWAAENDSVYYAATTYTVDNIDYRIVTPIAVDAVPDTTVIKVKADVKGSYTVTSPFYAITDTKVSAIAESLAPMATSGLTGTDVLASFKTYFAGTISPMSIDSVAVLAPKASVDTITGPSNGFVEAASVAGDNFRAEVTNNIFGSKYVAYYTSNINGAVVNYEYEINVAEAPKYTLATMPAYVNAGVVTLNGDLVAGVYKHDEAYFKNYFRAQAPAGLDQATFGAAGLNVDVTYSVDAADTVGMKALKKMHIDTTAFATKLAATDNYPLALGSTTTADSAYAYTGAAAKFDMDVLGVKALNVKAVLVDGLGAKHDSVSFTIKLKENPTTSVVAGAYTIKHDATDTTYAPIFDSLVVIGAAMDTNLVNTTAANYAQFAPVATDSMYFGGVAYAHYAGGWISHNYDQRVYLANETEWTVNGQPFATNNVVKFDSAAPAKLYIAKEYGALAEDQVVEIPAAYLDKWDYFGLKPHMFTIKITFEK